MPSKPKRRDALISLSLIIPAYNEARRLPAFLEKARRYLSQTYPRRHEIIVVDDGSTDDTPQVVERTLGKSALFSLARNQGKGAAVTAGMLQAHGTYRLFADADGATPIEEESRLREALQSEYDLAIGSRAAEGGVHRFRPFARNDKVTAEPSVVTWHVLPHRHLIGRVFSFLVKRTTGLDFEDTQCGFKMFRSAAALEVFSQVKSQRFAFDVEILYLAERLGLKIAEIPVNWRERPGSKVRLLADAWQMWGDLRRIRQWHSGLALPAPSVSASPRPRRRAR